jgi:hypothetical protein
MFLAKFWIGRDQKSARPDCRLGRLSHGDSILSASEISPENREEVTSGARLVLKGEDKKTFATLSARNGPTKVCGECLMFRAVRT